MGNAAVGEQETILVVHIQDNHPLRPQRLKARALPIGRIFGRQSVADAQVDQAAVLKGNHRPGYIVDVVAPFLIKAVVAPGDNLHRPDALQIPAGHIHIVGQSVQHRSGFRRTLEDFHHVGAGVIDPGLDADNAAQPPLGNLLLGQHPAPVVAAGIANPQFYAGTLYRRHNGIGVRQGQGQRLLHKNRLAQLQRLQNRLQMFMLRRGHHHGVDFRVGNDAVVVAGSKVGPNLLAQQPGPFRVNIGNGQKAHRGMAGGHIGPQSANPPGTHHRHAQILFFHRFYSRCRLCPASERREGSPLLLPAVAGWRGTAHFQGYSRNQALPHRVNGQ